MQAPIHSKFLPSKVAPLRLARLLALGISTLLPLGLPDRAIAIEDWGIDAFADLQELNPDKTELAFRAVIEEIEAERRAGRPQRALESATKLAPLVAENQKLLSVAQSLIGELYVDLKQWSLARSHFTNALRLAEARPGRGARRFEGPLMWLAGISVQVGELDVAERHYLRLLELNERAYGSPHYSTIGQLWALANLALRQSDLPKAEKYVQQELGIWSTQPKFFGKSIGDASTPLQNLGAIRAHQGKLSEAISLHLKARDLLQVPIRLASEDGSRIGAGALARAIECEERLISLYQKAGNATEAEQHTRFHQRFQALVTRPPYRIPHELWYQTLLPLP